MLFVSFVLLCFVVMLLLLYVRCCCFCVACDVLLLELFLVLCDVIVCVFRSCLFCVR